MVPSDQRLRAHHGTVADVHLGLEHQMQFLPLDPPCRSVVNATRLALAGAVGSVEFDVVQPAPL